MTNALAVKDQYVADFEAVAGNGAPAAPGWLRERRAEGIERFAQLGFPSGREEAWRFTSVKPLVKAPFAVLGPASDVTSGDLEPYALEPGQTNRIVFVNGWYRADLSSLEDLPADVTVRSLAEMLRENGSEAERHLAAYTRASGNPFTALSTAFMADGAYVRIPEGVTLERPLTVLHVAGSSARRGVSHPRNLILVGAGAAATVVEQYVGLADGPYWTNVVTEVVLGENARLDAYRVQQESEHAFHTATTQSYQATASNYALNTVVLGGALSRHDINAVLDGRGAECELYGLSQLRGRQHVDHHTAIDHAQPHCNSWEYFNGIFDGQSRGVFTGRIIVRPGAQRTDSKQTANSLLLSKQARADSQPQLEIYADDVKCTHGATLGPIDDRALFYLRSRGLTEQEARNLLTYGFGAEILGKIKLATVRDRLDAVIKARLRESATWSSARA